MVSLAGCGDQAVSRHDDTAGGRLEAAAVGAGLVIDPAGESLVGAWARDTDRMCIVSAGQGDLRVGARTDYGDGQGCVAAGSATRSGNRVRISFGECRFDAAFDGDRLVFPAALPTECERLCTGRASFAALTVDHLSTSASEAATLRAPDGNALCTG